MYEPNSLLTANCLFSTHHFHVVSHHLCTRDGDMWVRLTDSSLLLVVAREIRCLFFIKLSNPDRLYHRLVWKQHRWQPQGSAKGRANCPPSRISTPGGVQGKPGGLSKTPATRPTDCSLCCPQGDVYVASDPALADWVIAFSLRLSG